MKAPPHDLEAEKAVLGAILLHAPEVAPKALPLLLGACFYHPAHTAIHESILDCDSRGEPIDAITVWGALQRLGLSERLNVVGGDSYLVELMGFVVTTENVEFYARRVAEKAERRRLLAELSEVVVSGYDSTVGDAEWFHSLEAVMLRASEDRRTGYKPPEIRSALREYVAELGERYKRARSDSKLVGVPTGFSHLDNLTGGLRPGQQIVVAARPGMGKSAFALNVIEGAAERGTAVYVCSAEMSNNELLERMLSSSGDIGAMRLRNGDLDAHDWVKVQKTATRLADFPIVLDDQGCISIAELRSRVRRWRLTLAKDAKNALVVVDYLQLLKGAQQKRNGNRQEEVAEISGGLKALAKQCACPVISLAQLNRELERRADKRPVLSDLRESGSVEQDADIVMFLYRDEVYDDSESNPHRGTAELLIRKHRAGATGELWLKWEATKTRFTALLEAPPEKGNRNAEAY
jgi:replicative DNA helicase